MISADTAIGQARMAAHDFMVWALEDLLENLDIHPNDDPKWRDKLAPFAAVWAAMIAACASDFDTAVAGGAVAGVGPDRAVTKEG